MTNRRATALVVMMSLATGCASRSGGIGAALGGVAALGGGIALVATDQECVEDGCWFPSAQSVGGAALIAIGAAMILGGVIGYGRALDAERDAPPAPPPVEPVPDAPLLVDPANKATPADRAALQASYAARRDDCPGARAAMDQLFALDVALHEKLRVQDPPIARCFRVPAR